MTFRYEVNPPKVAQSNVSHEESQSSLSFFDQAFSEVNEVTPKSGYNICLFDDFAPIGEKLSKVEHARTWAQAEAIAQSFEAYGAKVYIYGDHDEFDDLPINESVAVSSALDKIKQRIINISKSCNGIHITDSVLGIPRVSPLTLAASIKDFNKKIEITTSLRVRDRTLTALEQFVSDAVRLKLNGILILKGDASANSPKDSGLIPSQVVKHLNELGFNKKIELFLSLPSNPDFKKIGKKLDAEPAGFITQVIHSEKQVTRIVDELKPQGFKVIPCILLPSEKNANSAKFLKLDWSDYEKNLVGFIKNIHSVAGDVLISSPNDFAKAQNLFESLE